MVKKKKKSGSFYDWSTRISYLLSRGWHSCKSDTQVWSCKLVKCILGRIQSLARSLNEYENTDYKIEETWNKNGNFGDNLDNFKDIEPINSTKFFLLAEATL